MSTFLCLVIFLILCLPVSGFSEASLTNEDCVKCHPKIVKENQMEGGKHKTKVKCLDCHRGHPPLVTEGVIPVCSQCHEGKPHYSLSNCSSCHTNPHTPLKLVLQGKIVGPCLTCHKDVGDEMKKSPSAHSQEVACNDCHSVHGEIPKCFKCHEAHSEDMTNKDCLVCHPPHRPLDIVYGKANIPNKYCGACHEELVQKLASTKTKHKDLACVFCHKNRHGYKPACKECHGIPHPEEMLEAFPKCTDCHIDAHGLVK